MIQEQVITLTIEQQLSLAIIHHANSQKQTTPELAMIIVVGGPQYRIGSHRQFIQLARFLASKGVTCMRFDTRGMGDSVGNKQPFDDLNRDIKTAIDGLQRNLPSIKNVVLWGLCDGASASLIYAEQDPRVCGLVLLNPWLENEQAMAKTMLKHYYLQRLFSKSFWQKLISGKVNLLETAKDASSMAKESFSNVELDKTTYQARMLNGLQQFSGRLCLITSGQDLTAQQFLEYVSANQAWQLIKKPDVYTCHISESDHTFSSAKFKKKVSEVTYDFIQKITYS